MANMCIVNPSVKRSDGEIVKSELFKNMREYANTYEEARDMYLITKNDEFMEKYLHKLTLDKNGEPTLTSIIEKTPFKKIFDDHKMLNILNRKMGYIKKDGTKYSKKCDNKLSELYSELVKANTANTSEEFKNHTAIVTATPQADGTVTVSGEVVKKTKDSERVAENMHFQNALHKRLLEILKARGVSVGVLEDFEGRLIANGVTYFDTANKTVDGLLQLIQVRDLQELPEEFAHLSMAMLGENNPLVQRLLNFMTDDYIKEILGNSYEAYNTKYDGNQRKLKWEAAGKLLAQHLLKNNEENIKPKSLIKRITDAVKSFFSRLSASELERARMDSRKEFGRMARELLKGSLESQMSLDNIDSTLGELYSLEERIEKDKATLQNVVNTLVKLNDIFQITGGTQESLLRQDDALKKANEYYNGTRGAASSDSIDYINGIYEIINVGTQEVAQALQELRGLTNDDSINTKAKIVRNAEQTFQCFHNIIVNVKERIADDENELADSLSSPAMILYDDDGNPIFNTPEEEEAYNEWRALHPERYTKRIKDRIADLDSLLYSMKSIVSPLKKSLVIDFLKQYAGESIVAPFGKNKDKVVTIEQLLKEAEQDIGFMERWIDSMAHNSDEILRILDHAVKQVKGDIRLNLIDFIKEIEAAAVDLGGDTEFMFEVDDEGNLTGNYVSTINWGLFHKDCKKKQEEFGDDHQGYLNWLDSVSYRHKNKTYPKPSIERYKGKFDTLSDKQQKFYEVFMRLKTRMDSLLPPDTMERNSIIKIRKELFERVMKNGLSGKQVWEAVKDQFMRRSDESEFGTVSLVSDFNGKVIEKLPIYYTKLKDGENMNDVSTDAVSTLIAYAAMALEYDGMHDVVHILELTRDTLSDRQIKQTVGGNPILNRVNKWAIEGSKYITKEASSSLFMDRLNDFYKMQVYGRYYEDEGTFGDTNIDKGKTANLLNWATALHTFAFNLISGISNVMTGSVMMRIESFCGEFFKERDTLWADKEYTKQLVSVLGELGNRVKVSKLALFDEMFDVFQDWEAAAKDTNWNKDNWFKRLFNSNGLYVFNNAGEHWMQNRTALALAHAYKMKDAFGKDTNLWEALEIEYVDPANHSKGAKLKIKDGYTKADGTEFTRDDIKAFTSQAAGINQNMHGIYNKADRAALQKFGIGRMIFMYRKWIPASIHRRFGKATKNYDIGAYQEGYYRSFGRLLWQTAKDLRNLQLHLTSNYKNMTPHEKANIIRAVTEIGHFAVLAGILLLVKWPDDKNRPWHIKMLEYQTRRLYTELGAMTPNPMMLKEALKIVKSPMASIHTMESILDVFKLLNPWNYELVGGEDALLRSGRYKGHTRAFKAFMESPFLPFNKTIYRWLNPDSVLSALKN